MASDQSLTGLFSSHHGTKFFKQNTLIFSFFYLKTLQNTIQMLKNYLSTPKHPLKIKTNRFINNQTDLIYFQQ